MVFNALQLLRDEWKLNLSKAFVPVGERKKLRSQRPTATKTPAIPLSFEERIAMRKYTPHTGIPPCSFYGEEDYEDDCGEQQDECKIICCSSVSSSSSATSSSSSALVTASDGTTIKVEDDEAVIPAAPAAPPAKKTRKG